MIMRSWVPEKTLKRGIYFSRKSEKRGLFFSGKIRDMGLAFFLLDKHEAGAPKQNQNGHSTNHETCQHTTDRPPPTNIPANMFAMYANYMFPLDPIGRNKSAAHQHPQLHTAQPLKQPTRTLQGQPKTPQPLRVHFICCKEIRVEDNEGPYFGVFT